MNYNQFQEKLLDEFSYTFFDSAPGDEDGGFDPFIQFTIKTLFDSGVTDTVKMMEIIEPMLIKRDNHLGKLLSEGILLARHQ